MSNDVDHLVALDALDWKPLKTERIKAKSKLMFKLLNKMCPKSLTDLFTFKSEMTNYKLRDVESTLCLPQPRTNSLKKSFMFDGAHIWNYLPTEIRESNSIMSFETKIATHIFEYSHFRIALLFLYIYIYIYFLLYVISYYILYLCDFIIVHAPCGNQPRLTIYLSMLCVINTSASCQFYQVTN